MFKVQRKGIFLAFKPKEEEKKSKWSIICSKYIFSMYKQASSNVNNHNECMHDASTHYHRDCDDGKPRDSGCYTTIAQATRIQTISQVLLVYFHSLTEKINTLENILASLNTNIKI